MPDSKPNRPAVFIEKIFPVTLLNQQVYYEHGGNPFKGLHRWYSRKPLSFSRASVLGSLLPDTVTPEEFEYLLGLQRRLGGQPDTTTKLYKTPPSPERIQQVHDLCEQTWGTRTPTVLDAFAGGGSIPFEAVRYGLNVLASDLNPVAVVTMKAAMEYPLKFGPDLQHEIDKWVKWVGDEAEKRLGSFFPSQEGETVQNYLWAHTVVCPSCESVVPLSPNWWLYKRPEKQNLHKWCAVKPIPNPAKKRVDFELVKGRKGKGTTIQTDEGDFDPNYFNTISRGVGKCCNCGNVIENDVVTESGKKKNLGDQLYAVAYRKGSSNLEFRSPNIHEAKAVNSAKNEVDRKQNSDLYLFPTEETPPVTRDSRLRLYGIEQWIGIFNPRQLLTLATYVEILNDLKEKLNSIYELDRVEAILTYLAFVFDRCVDMNCRMSAWDPTRSGSKRASAQHSLNLMWNYSEISGAGELWRWCAAAFISDYENLCQQLGRESANLLNPNPNPPVAQSSRLQTPQAISIQESKPEACATNFGEDGESANLLNSNPNPLVAQSSRLQIPPTSIPESKPEACATNLEEGQNLVAQASSLQISEDSRGSATSIQGSKPEACATRSGDGEIRKRKRKNLPHWEMDGAVYAIGFTTQERLELPPEARQVVLDACKFFDGERYVNYAIVVMPDHVHWLVQPLPKEDGSYWSLSSLTHSIKSYTAKEIPKVMKHIGKVWQIESYDRIVRDEREFFDTWEYIRQNPVKAGLSESPETYPFFWQMEEHVAQASSLQTLEDSQSKPEACATKEKNSVAQASSLPTLEGTQSKPEACATIMMASADALLHIPDKSLDAVVTDPPYYATIQYSELSDFFYVWQKRVLGDIFPELYFSELTDKDREAVANPSRFRNMGESAEELANRDYEAKMALAFAEYFRVLRDDGVMTVQFNHKDSGAWDVLAKSLIDAGFEITASWAVSTENPQNLHQAQKNSVSSTVLLVCRKRDPNAGSAWWDEVRIDLSNTVTARAPELEEALQSGKEQKAYEGVGIDLYLSAFGPALNVFSRAWPVLDSSGVEMRPEVAFAEARKAIANYRFRKLLEADTAGFDPLTQWYILAWDAFRAREFPFDEARQLALAVGGFNVNDLAKVHKLIDSASGKCKFLTPQQRLKKRAFSTTTNPDEFSAAALIDGLHAVIALYLEEQSIDPVRRFLKATGLLSNDLFMRAWEVALKAIPHIGDERKRMVEEKALADLWLAMDEIQAKVVYVQPELEFEGGAASARLRSLSLNALNLFTLGLRNETGLSHNQSG